MPAERGKFFVVQFIHFVLTEKNPALARPIFTDKQPDHRGLSGPGPPRERDELARINLERNVLKRRLLSIVIIF
jgi:hypothetical protein